MAVRERIDDQLDLSGDARREPARTVKRPRGLPGGRAMVGGLLVAVSGIGLFAAASTPDPAPEHSYAVAARDLSAGARLVPGDLDLLAIDLPDEVRARAFDNRGHLADTTLLGPVMAGELVQAGNVVAKPSDAASRELTLSFDGGRVAGELSEGERIDLLATFGTGDDSHTEIVGRGVLVVGIDRASAGLGNSNPTVITVGIPDIDEVIAVAHASQVAKLTPVRATGVSVTVGPSPILPEVGE